MMGFFRRRTKRRLGQLDDTIESLGVSVEKLGVYVIDMKEEMRQGHSGTVSDNAKILKELDTIKGILRVC